MEQSPSNEKKSIFARVHMVVWILLCAGIGAGIGLILTTQDASSEWAIWLGMPGTLWIRCLKLMILPLVFCSVVTAVTGLDDIGVGTSTIARNTVILYTITTLWGVAEGLAVTFMLKPLWHGETGSYVTISPKAPSFDSGARIDIVNADYLDGHYNAVTAATVEFQLPDHVNKTVLTGSDIIYYFDQTVSFNLPLVLDAEGKPVSGGVTDLKVFAADGEVSMEMAEAFSVIIPGGGSSRSAISRSFEQLVYSIFPDNIVEMAYGGAGGPDLLSLITFAIAFAVGLVACRRKWSYKTDAVLLFFQQTLEITMWLILFVVKFTPIAVGCLMIKTFASQSLPDLATAFGSLGVLIAGLVGAFLFHILVFLSGMCFIIVRFNPYKHIAGVSRAIVVALGCASSAVTLPTNILCCEAMGLRPSVVRFVLSLGATVSMDGSAIYIPSAIIWLATQANMSMNFGQVIILAITATLSSAGASPTPGTIPTLILAYGTVFPGVPISEKGLAYLAVVDWFVDRCVTATNITGDSFMARIVDHFISDDSAFPGSDDVAASVVDVEQKVVEAETFPAYAPAVEQFQQFQATPSPAYSPYTAQPAYYAPAPAV